MRLLKVFALGMAGAFFGVALLVGLAWWQDIFTVSRDGTVHLRVDQSGNIGIGTAAVPSARLSVQGTGTTSSTQGFSVTNATGTTTFVVQDNGPVGIGTANPLTKLHLQDGSLYVSAASSSNNITMDRPAGAYSELKYKTAGSNRWSFFITNEAESGGNAGSNFRIQIYNDAGVPVATALAITRSTNSVGIATAPSAGAKLEIGGTDGALLIPRLTTVQRDALTAANGMIVYNTTTNAFNFYENGAWVTK